MQPGRRCEENAELVCRSNAFDERLYSLAHQSKQYRQSSFEASRRRRVERSVQDCLPVAKGVHAGGHLRQWHAHQHRGPR